uniref:Attacin C-terminal domain-containing protein n=1 Tax=Graphocephala atropunctata TaxID=36148 RepID=A0A1B6KHG3_9HEMI
MSKKETPINKAALALHIFTTTIAMSNGNKNWNVAVHEINPGNTVVSGHYSVPLHQNGVGTMVGSVHASKSFTGHGGLPSVGGSLYYTHVTGISGSINANPSLRGPQSLLSANANVPLFKAPYGHLDANVHGSQTFGLPDTAHSHTYGAGMTYAHHNGVFGGVDVTRGGQGNTYSATAGVGHQLGPGRFILTGGAFVRPGSDKVDGQVWGRYQIPLPQFH